MPRWIAFKTGDPDGFKSFMERGRAACGGLFERPFVSWRDDVALFMGPRLAGYSAVRVSGEPRSSPRGRRRRRARARYAAGHGSGAGRSRISARLWRPLPGAGRSPGRHPDGRRRRSSRRACFDLISWCRGHRRDGADHPLSTAFHAEHRWLRHRTRRAIDADRRHWPLDHQLRRHGHSRIAAHRLHPRYYGRQLDDNSCPGPSCGWLSRPFCSSSAVGS
jgi:hypothetical protein